MYVPPNNGNGNNGSLATTDTVVAGVVTMYTYDRLRYWYPIALNALSMMLMLVVCLFGVAAIPVYTLLYYVKNTYIEELQLAQSWDDRTFKAMKGYLFGKFLTKLGWVMFVSWFSAYWWAHQIGDGATLTKWYLNLIGIIGSYIALPISWIGYPSSDITYALSGGLVGYHHAPITLYMGMIFNAAIVLTVIGYVWSAIRLGNRDVSEFSYRTDGFDPDRLDMYGVKLDDFSTMGVPASTICYHPRDRTPVIFQLAYYLDLKAKLMPLNIGTEYMSGPKSSEYEDYMSLKDRMEHLMAIRPDLVAKAFKTVFIRDPYGDPHTLPDYDVIAAKAANMVRKSQIVSGHVYTSPFADEMWRYVYTKHPLRPADDPFIGPFPTAGKTTTSHFTDGFKYTTEYNDVPYNWVKPSHVPPAPAVTVTAATKFRVTRSATPTITFKDASEALKYIRDYLGANNMKHGTYRDAKLSLEQGNTYVYKAFMDGMDITITPTN